MRIQDGNDRAKELGFKNYRQMVNRMAKKAGVPWNGTSTKAGALQAYINGGRWLARCDYCGNVFYVTPDDPFFYCPECGNEGLNGAARPVTFPNLTQRTKIETLLRRRPIRLRKSRGHKTQLAAGAIPELLRRDWSPGVTVAMVKAQNAAVGLSTDDTTPVPEEDL